MILKTQNQVQKPLNPRSKDRGLLRELAKSLDFTIKWLFTSSPSCQFDPGARDVTLVQDERKNDMTHSDELTQAVHRVQGGDVESFALVVRTHQDEVGSFWAMLGVPSGDIEEVAQDAFVDAFTAIRSYDCQQKLLPWL